MIGIVLFALAASASATVFNDGACPEVTTVDNFNIKTFGTGKWYEVAKYSNNLEAGAKCGWAEYVLDGDSYSIKNYDVLNGKLRFVSGSGRLADGAGTSGKLIYTYPYGPGGANSEHKLNILYNDGQTAVLYYCKQGEKNHQDFSWIFSRSKNFEGNSKTNVEKFINDNEILNFSQYVFTDFSEEACKVEA